MNIDAKEIELIVQKVLENIDVKTLSTPKADNGEDGVFDHVEEAIEAAYQAQRRWVKDYNLEDRKRIIAAIRRVSEEHAEELAKMVRKETGMGRYEDKVKKHLAVIRKTPGVECLTTDAISGDEGLMIEECAPFGVIGAITPSTNPTETIINAA